MDTLSLLFFFLFLFPYRALCKDTCQPVACGITEVRFPFRLRRRQAGHCGYRGFDLSCNNHSQAVLTLPSSGNYPVTQINYASQQIYIRPDFCIPERILSFSLRGSPFRGVHMRNFTFYNCSSSPREMVMYPAVTLACLGGDNYTVIAMPSFPFDLPLPLGCRNISTISLPFAQNQNMYFEMFGGDLQLTWSTPNCRSCEAKGGTCGLKTDSRSGPIGCSNLPRQGLSRPAKYGIIMGVGIPGLVCIIGLACFTCSRIKAYSHRRHLTAELSNVTSSPQPSLFMMGLDGPTIESYPKSVIGESRRLPKHSDGTCPICLSEYQPKDTLRSIPECNHCFHADCIDEWLGLNATCPVCRNSPETSSVVTPSSSTSSSFTTSSNS